MEKEKIIKQILQECFWDMSFSIEEIDKIVNGEDFRKKAFLFDKILLNNTKLFAALSVFNKNDLERLIKEYKIPGFNSDIAKRRLNLAETYFLDEPLTIEELSWTV